MTVEMEMSWNGCSATHASYGFTSSVLPQTQEDCANIACNPISIDLLYM